MTTFSHEPLVLADNNNIIVKYAFVTSSLVKSCLIHIKKMSNVQTIYFLYKGPESEQCTCTTLIGNKINGLLQHF